jgi:flagellin-like protein
MRNRKALSEVVTTLILLVVAVLLAAVATYYATNITMTRTENEQIALSKPHIWVGRTYS